MSYYRQTPDVSLLLRKLVYEESQMEDKEDFSSRLMMELGKRVR